MFIAMQYLHILAQNNAVECFCAPSVLSNSFDLVNVTGKMLQINICQWSSSMGQMGDIGHRSIFIRSHWSWVILGYPLPSLDSKSASSTGFEKFPTRRLRFMMVSNHVERTSRNKKIFATKQFWKHWKSFIRECHLINRNTHQHVKT